MTETVGMIGLGVLGSAIAPNIAAGGFEVFGYDVDEDKVKSLGNAGIRAAGSAAEVAKAADTVFLCLPSAAALAAVSQEIAASGAMPLVVEISTLTLADKEAARDRLAAAGITLLDCPVSGNRIAAQARELTAFGSGPREDFERVEPILTSFCRKAQYVGEFGAGIKMKMCGNILNLVHNAVTAEVLVLAMKSGLDPRVVHETISGSFSSSRVFEVRGAMMVENDYDREGANFSIPLKDSKIIASHAIDVMCPIPLYQTALQSYYAAVAQGHHDEDQAAVCAAMERAANCERKG